MVTWNIPTQNYKQAIEIFLSKGADTPEGATILGCWHVPGSNYGWVLVEGDKLSIAEHLAQWAGFL